MSVRGAFSTNTKVTICPKGGKMTRLKKTNRRHLKVLLAEPRNPTVNLEEKTKKRGKGKERIEGVAWVRVKKKAVWRRGVCGKEVRNLSKRKPWGNQFL